MESMRLSRGRNTMASRTFITFTLALMLVATVVWRPAAAGPMRLRSLQQVRGVRLQLKLQSALLLLLLSLTGPSRPHRSHRCLRR
jgi:hypothetical protein